MQYNGALLYHGPSLLVKKQTIAAIVTNLYQPSKNPKTDDMAQAFIILCNEHPCDAMRNGKDEAVCGHCPLRGKVVIEKGRKKLKRPCYVNPMSPTAIYNAMLRRRYPRVTPRAIADVVAQRPLRIGAYGDPAAVPLKVWTSLTKHHDTKRTGYTHQWRTCDPGFKRLVMASVDTMEEWAQAKEAGWRTFRVRTADQWLMPNEIVCPASEEGGHRTNCAKCGLCNGKLSDDDARKDICIIAHGFGKKNFEECVG